MRLSCGDATAPGAPAVDASEWLPALQHPSDCAEQSCAHLKSNATNAEQQARHLCTAWQGEVDKLGSHLCYTAVRNVQTSTLIDSTQKCSKQPQTKSRETYAVVNT